MRGNYERGNHFKFQGGLIGVSRAHACPLKEGWKEGWKEGRKTDGRSLCVSKGMNLQELGEEGWREGKRERGSGREKRGEDG